MKCAKLGIFFIFTFFASVFSQIENVKFTDLKGRSYDLHQLLESGKYVYVYMTFNG